MKGTENISQMAFLYLDSYRTVGEKVGNSLWFISVLSDINSLDFKNIFY